MHKPIKGLYICTKCKKEKADTEFYPDYRKKSGISSWCRSCSLAAAVNAAKRRKEARIRAISNMYKVPYQETDE